MEFQWSYSKSWKMMLWKCCTQYASKSGKLSSGHRTGKGQFSFQSQRKWKWKVKSFSRVRLFVTPWTVAYQAPLSMGFSRQEYWSGLPFPSPGDIPKSGIEPWSPALQADALISELREKGNAKECSNYHTIALISHASKVIVKILQARLQQYVNHELPDVQAGFRKDRGTRDQIANIHWIIEKVREFQKKNIHFCFIDYSKAVNCVDHKKLWKIQKEMGIQDHLICLLRNLYAGQEATVRTGHGTTDWFQIRKGIRQGCLLSPCLFNFYAECIMRNAGLEEAQLESRLSGEISITSDMQMTPPLWQKVKRN